MGDTLGRQDAKMMKCAESFDPADSVQFTEQYARNDTRLTA